MWLIICLTLVAVSLKSPISSTTLTVPTYIDWISDRVEPFDLNFPRTYHPKQFLFATGSPGFPEGVYKLCTNKDIHGTTIDMYLIGNVLQMAVSSQ